MAAGDEGLEPESQHPLVEALVPDPSALPLDAVVLIGLAGRSSKEGALRLYLTATLDEYVDILSDDVLHRKELPDDGGTQVWVRRSATLTHVQVAAQDVPAAFLAGSIAALAAGTPDDGGDELRKPPTMRRRCPPPSAGCVPPMTAGCETTSGRGCLQPVAGDWVWQGLLYTDAGCGRTEICNRATDSCTDYGSRCPTTNPRKCP